MTDRMSTIDYLRKYKDNLRKVDLINDLIGYKSLQYCMKRAEYFTKGLNPRPRLFGATLSVSAPATSFFRVAATMHF